jgi:hypothetical protein
MEPVEQARVMPARDDKYLTICLDVPLVRKQDGVKLFSVPVRVARREIKKYRFTQ